MKMVFSEFFKMTHGEKSKCNFEILLTQLHSKNVFQENETTFSELTVNHNIVGSFRVSGFSTQTYVVNVELNLDFSW